MHRLANSTVTEIAILQFDDTSAAGNPVIAGNPWLLEPVEPDQGSLLIIRAAMRPRRRWSLAMHPLP
jgi:hypothetical protein